MIADKQNERIPELMSDRWLLDANANAQRLIELVGSFDPDWRRDLEQYLVDQRKDAVNSVVDLRNTISHGRHVGVTMRRVGDYYEQIKDVVEHIAGICDPQNERDDRREWRERR